MPEVVDKTRWVQSQKRVLSPTRNGKSKPDEGAGDGYNKRDLTPVGGRPPGAGKAVVPEDPEATAAHKRNQARRLKFAQTDSD